VGIATRICWLSRVALIALSIACAGCVPDEHRSVTKQMGWQCVGVVDTRDKKFPHVEGIKLWFLDNPHYEEHASGPQLCAELAASGRPDVAVTFDVWGNRFNGLHGYNLTTIAVRSKLLTLYGSESGGFHDDTWHYGNFDSKIDQKQHPEVYRFPLDVF
jgi:hypothetical protein